MLTQKIFGFVSNLSQEHRIFHKSLLVLYVLSAALYFWGKYRFGGGSPHMVVMKCAPIWILILFIFVVWRFQRPYRYPISMVFGLLMSFIGDAFLTQDDDSFFIAGLITFALAHVMYMKAFTLRPLNLRRAVKIYAICIGTFIVYLLINHHVTQKLTGIRLYVVAFACIMYSALLYGSFWRAVAKISSVTDLKEWNNLTKCIGTVLFILSDNILVINHFLVSIPYAWVPTMITYYIAQLCLALSVVQPTSKGSFICRIPPVQYATPIHQNRSSLSLLNKIHTFLSSIHRNHLTSSVSLSVSNPSSSSPARQKVKTR